MSSIPILMLKEGTEKRQGRSQVVSNIDACNNVADNIRSTLGPRGMDKLIVDRKGKTTISNDGATILKQLDVVYPAAAIICDIAKSQDKEVGDGTTSVVLLAAELLKQAKPYIEEGVSPQLIIKTYGHACHEAIKKLHELAVRIQGKEQRRDMLVKCAATALSSKLLNQEREKFAEMVVDAVSHLDEGLPLEMVGLKRIAGGSLGDSQLVKGVAFKKAFSYAGFEMQPKHYVKPLIAILNVELEVRAERENAEMRITNVAEYQKIVDAEWTLLYDKLEKLHAAGARIVLSRLPIGDVATMWFADRDMFCAGRVPEDDLQRVIAACGGSLLTTVSQLGGGQLGRCDKFYEKQVGNERFNFIIGGQKAKTCTLLLRGGSEQFIAETERSLHDAIMITRRVTKSDSIVAGGGAIEMELGRHIREVVFKTAGKEQFFLLAFAKSLETIPFQISLNAGLDAVEMINTLRARHQKGKKWQGVDVHKERISDNFDGCVWEPTVVKENAIIAATEAACLVLSIDQTIKNPAAQNRMPGLPGM